MYFAPQRDVVSIGLTMSVWTGCSILVALWAPLFRNLSWCCLPRQQPCHTSFILPPICGMSLTMCSHYESCILWKLKCPILRCQSKTTLLSLYESIARSVATVYKLYKSPSLKPLETTLHPLFLSFIRHFWSSNSLVLRDLTSCSLKASSFQDLGHIKHFWAVLYLHLASILVH